MNIPCLYITDPGIRSKVVGHRHRHWWNKPEGQLISRNRFPLMLSQSIWLGCNLSAAAQTARQIIHGFTVESLFDSRAWCYLNLAFDDLFLRPLESSKGYLSASVIRTNQLSYTGHVTNRTRTPAVIQTKFIDLIKFSRNDQFIVLLVKILRHS